MTPNEESKCYRAHFPPKAMKRPAEHEDELRQMVAADGMLEMPSPIVPPELFVRHNSLPNTQESVEEARHLWVIRSVDFPVALESCAWGVTLKGGRIKHSNLTGGEPAHSGGEIWFIDDSSVVVNAASGRYGAESETEFSEIVEALRCSGFRVASMGFDVDNAAIPNRVLVGEPDWRSPK